MNVTNNSLIAKVLLGVFVLLILIAGAFFIQQSQKTLSVVYMATGEVYVGKLTTFPRLTLRDGYLFQAGVDPQDPDKATQQLVPLSDAVWAPRVFYLNRDQVVFSGPISETSQIFEAIKTENAAQSQ